MTNTPEYIDGHRADTLSLMAVGRLILGTASLTAPRQFARIIGVRDSPELTYLTRIYGARALAMGLGWLTGDPAERARWTRLGLMIDASDSLAGLARLLRRDVPVRAAVGLFALSGSYAAVGAAKVFSR
jgi:hypothetical protein